MMMFLEQLLIGAKVTILVTVLAGLLAVAMGFIAGLCRLSRFKAVRAAATVYVEVFRGTSALVQLFWMYFVLPLFGIRLSAFQAAVLALGLNIGAYGAEIVRGAVLSVSKGQYEAATALNMSRFKMMTRVILPQAVVSMLPPWGNLLIELLKSTALVSLITLSDLAFRAYQLNQATFKTVEIFTLVLFLYFTISLAITALIRILERILGRGILHGGLN